MFLFTGAVAPATQSVASTAAPAAEAATQGTQAAAQQGGGLVGMLPFFLIIGVWIFFLFRSQKKQQQKRQQMLEKIVKGSRVMTNAGMIGVIVEVREKTYLIDIGNNVKVEFVKNGIADVVAEDGDAPRA